VREVRLKKSQLNPAHGTKNPPITFGEGGKTEEEPAESSTWYQKWKNKVKENLKTKPSYP